MTEDELYTLRVKASSLSYPEKVTLGREYVFSLRVFLQRQGKSREEAEAFVGRVIKAAVSADRFAGNDEYELYCDIFQDKLPYEEFFYRTDGGATESFLSDLTLEISLLNKYMEAECCELFLLFLFSDYNLEWKETALLRKLFVRNAENARYTSK